MSSKKIIKRILNQLPLITHLSIWGGFFTLLWSRAYFFRNGNWIAGHLAHWTDGAAHLAYMSAFAYRKYFPLTHPLYAFHPFNYSFMADLIGGLFTRLGFPLYFSYMLIGLILTLGVIILLWWFYRLCFGGGWLPTVASALFLLSGGFGFRYFIKDINTQGFIDTIQKLPRLYTQQEDLGLVWLNVVIGELLPQRAFLLGLIIGLFCLTLWYQYFILKKKISRSLLIFSGVLAGTLPIVHPHTFIVLAISGICFFIYKILNLKSYILSLRAIRNTCYVILPCLFVFLPLYFTFISPVVSNATFIKTQLGWMAATKKVNILWFWLNNWGLFLPLSLLSIFIVNKKTKILFLISYLLFLISNIVLFQPYEWDNAKIFTWVYLILSGFVATLFIKLWSIKISNKLLVTRNLLLVTIFIICTFSGLLDNLRATQTSHQQIQLFNKSDIEMSEKFKQVTDPESIVLTATFHDNWVAALTGRQVLIGYRGWMWTYGINDASRYRDMNAMYRGDAVAKDLLKKYQINYVIVGQKEKSEFKVNTTFFEDSYPVILQNSNTKVYRITPQ